MKRYKLFFAVLPLFALLLFSGCTAILERSYSYEAEHVSADDGSASGLNVPELSDYRALEGTLQELIERHVFVQTVRLVDYSGDVERDVQRAVHSIMATPLGDFAVNNIAYQSSRILSYYEIRFDVSYRRTEQELEELQYAENMDALISLMTEKMSQFSTSILAEIDDYNPTFYDFEQIYQNIYYSNPASPTASGAWRCICIRIPGRIASWRSASATGSRC